MNIRLLVLIGISALIVACRAQNSADGSEDRETVSRVDEKRFSIAKDVRYLLYDVNQGEGFNLRRDVHMRVAIAAKQMRERGGQNIILVLPPWSSLYHWRKGRRTRVSWSSFFDVESLARFTPTIEFEQFLKETNGAPIDRVVYLQQFSEGWGDEYKMKNEKRPCNDGDKYYLKTDNGLWMGWFYDYKNVRARDFECVSFQGDSHALADLIVNNYTDTSLLVDRAETALHEHYGEVEYWRARRSMRYATRLEDIAARFRKEFLDSDDEKDGTVLPPLWEDETPRRSATGGPYLCAHWRRRDFVQAHGTNLPSIRGAAKQMTDLASALGLKKVFVATDAPSAEIDELVVHLGAELVVFTPSEDEPLADGEAAIVEQIICSNARAFTGSHTSTFSYRIQEDREIRGLPVETTFNRMCSDSEKKKCEQPAKWKIVYS